MKNIREKNEGDFGKSVIITISSKRKGFGIKRSTSSCKNYTKGNWRMSRSILKTKDKAFLLKENVNKIPLSNFPLKNSNGLGAEKTFRIVKQIPRSPSCPGNPQKLKKRTQIFPKKIASFLDPSHQRRSPGSDTLVNRRKRKFSGKEKKVQNSEIALKKIQGKNEQNLLKIFNLIDRLESVESSSDMESTEIGPRSSLFETPKKSKIHQKKYIPQNQSPASSPITTKPNIPKMAKSKNPKNPLKNQNLQTTQKKPQNPTPNPNNRLKTQKMTTKSKKFKNPQQNFFSLSNFNDKKFQSMRNMNMGSNIDARKLTFLKENKNEVIVLKRRKKRRLGVKPKETLAYARSEE
jgi:hypothetical protein